MSDAPKSFEGIMVSSTFSDLKAHRQEVIDAISRLGFHPVAMEHSGASDADVISKSLQMVRDCSVYVLIISHKYGQAPKDPRNPDGVSITELEFNEAVRLGRPRLLFVMADDHPVLKEDVEPSPGNRRKLKKFKEQAKRVDPATSGKHVHCVWEAFAGPEQLGKVAAIAVANYAIGKAGRQAGPEPQLSGKDIAALLKAARDLAQQRSVGTEAMIALARRVAENVSEPEMAEAQLHSALDEFVELRARAEQGSNLGDLVDETMRALNQHNERGDLDAGAKAIERGIAALREREAELKAGQARLIDAAIEQNRLRFDVDAVTRWLCEKVLTDQGKLTASALFVLIKEWCEPALVRGLRFEMDVAIALAERALELATDDGERGDAFNWLGIVTKNQGDRTGGEAGQTLLERAVAAYEAALVVRREDMMPAKWATTQNNLGNALWSQGERAGGEAGLTLLARSIAAFEAALRLRKEGTMPVQWAMTQNNVGCALLAQGERAVGEAQQALLSRAVSAFEAALRVRTEDAMPAEWATTQNNLGNALLAQGKRARGEARQEVLIRAVATYKAALRIRIEDSMAAAWAMTQNNLGNALLALGEQGVGEAGQTWLMQAVVAYEGALRARTENTMPAKWAMTRNNMAFCHKAQAERSSDPLPHWRAAEQAAQDALRVYTPEQMPYYHEKATHLLIDIRAEIARLGG